MQEGSASRQATGSWYKRFSTSRNTSIPLVLHGTSGVPDEAVQECIRRGICKVNYATDLQIAFTRGVNQVLTVGLGSLGGALTSYGKSPEGNPDGFCGFSLSDSVVIGQPGALPGPGTLDGTVYL